ncbi:MAG: TerD family protein [Cardiobacteriaceae bacterium]|nr:TerD family protein [Cardiobacteriaceae bacterium]
MAISLQKGGNVSLSKQDPNLKQLLIGLGWDTRQTAGTDFDLDGSAFLLNSNGKVRSEADFIFYNQLQSADGSVEHSGDNRTGAGDGDDETLLIRLDKLSPDVEKIAITVTIHDAASRGQNFGQVKSAFVRCINQETGEELARFDLSEDASVETAMIFGEIYRHQGEWKFRAVGQGFADGLLGLARYYGVPL